MKSLIFLILFSFSIPARADFLTGIVLGGILFGGSSREKVELTPLEKELSSHPYIPQYFSSGFDRPSVVIPVSSVELASEVSNHYKARGIKTIQDGRIVTLDFSKEFAIYKDRRFAAQKEWQKTKKTIKPYLIGLGIIFSIFAVITHLPLFVMILSPLFTLLGVCSREFTKAKKDLSSLNRRIGDKE